MALILDESQVSAIEDVDTLVKISAASNGKPAWVGAYRPATANEAFSAQRVWACAHYDFYMNFVRGYMDRRGRVLDIGCGNGQNTAMLARYAESALGVDTDIEFANTHNRVTGAEFVSGKFPEVPDNSLRFDYIFCVETIEHIPHEEHKAFLDTALGMLTPGGLMFLTTPNEETSGGEHRGIWSSAITEKMLKYLTPRVVHYAHFNNANPGMGFLPYPCSHRALVLKHG